MSTSPDTMKRTQLTADRVLAGALALADEIGIDDLTIRRLADALVGEMIEHFPADRYPRLAEFTVEHVLRPGYDFTREFDFGLS